MTKRVELVIKATYQPDVGAQVELLRGLLVRLRTSEIIEEVPDAPSQHGGDLVLVEVPNESTPRA